MTPPQRTTREWLSAVLGGLLLAASGALLLAAQDASTSPSVGGYVAGGSLLTVGLAGILFRR